MKSYQLGIIIGAAICLVSIHVEFGFYLIIYLIAISSIGAIVEERLDNEAKR